MTHKLKWDDLQIVMALARSGSANRAARYLGLNHSTILRRLHAFEQRHGVKLFERHPTGVRATNAGREMLAAVEGIENSMLEIERGLLGQDQRLAGDITLTTTDTLLTSVLAEPLVRFRASHPDICVRVVMTNTRLELPRLDADLAVRPSLAPPDDLVGRQVSRVGFAVYGAHGRAGELSVPLDAPAPWIGVCEELAESPVGPWMAEHVSPDAIAARGNSFVAIREMARCGLGRAVLPCCLGEPDPSLTRLRPVIRELDTSLWILMHKDLRSRARVRALADHLARTLRSSRRVLEGI